MVLMILQRFVTVRNCNLPRSLYRRSSLFSTETLISPLAAECQDRNNPYPSCRPRTPLEKQFQSWISKFKPGFTPSDVKEALLSLSDPDLALDIFRWTAQQRGYKHNHLTYLTIIDIAASGKRFGQAETLMEEVIAGACNDVNTSLYNAVIRFCCGKKCLLNRAFDVYKIMLKSEDCKPSLETYNMLFNSLLRRFSKLNVCYVYLHSVRSLTKQMKASGVIPDTFVLNMIIKAYSMCHEVDEALRVFKEMRLYGCDPNAYTYSYITRGLCVKGRLDEGWGYHKEMREKGLVPTSSSYMIVICSLSMERRFEDAIDTTYDMLSHSRAPDLLTYKTLLEEMCRDGRDDHAFGLVEEFRKRDKLTAQKFYNTLLNELHFLKRDS